MLATAALPDSVVPGAVITLGEPSVRDGVATYDASGDALVYGLRVTEDALREQVRSKTIAEAQRILGEFGTANITLSPDFLPALPDDPNRIEIETGPPPPGATPAPMSSPTPSSGPATSPAPSGSVVAGRGTLRSAGTVHRTGTCRVTSLLGVDLGERRIGLAVGDPGTGIARPLRTITRRDAAGDIATLGALVREHHVVGLVVGLPLSTDGTEGEQAARTREWAAAVAPALGLSVTWQDERYTSVSAEARIGRPGRGRAGGPPSSARLRGWRARIDREAATAILQSALDAQRRGADTAEPVA